MATQRRRFAQRSGPSRTDWGRAVLPYVTVAAATKVLLTSFVLINSGISETVRRTRGRFGVISDQASTTEQNVGAIGFIVVSDLALAAGAASIPGPVTDASDDGWFVWEGFAAVSQFTLAVSNAGAAQGSLQVDFDSKAMRKVPDGFGIAVMAENTSGGGGWEIGMTVSILGSRN